MQKQVIAFDLETHPFSPCNMAPRPVCLSWAHGEKFGLLVRPDIEKWIHKALDKAIEGSVVLTGHYVAFDFSCLMEHIPSIREKVWYAYGMNGVTCTMAREQLLDIAIGEYQGHWSVDGKRVKHGYTLADIMKRRLNHEISKGADTWRMRYQELDGVPVSDWPAPAVEYAVTDAVAALALFRDQAARAAKLNYNLPTEFDEARADLALRLTSVWGIETDQEHVSRLWEDTCTAMHELTSELVASGIVQPQPVIQSMFADKSCVPEVKQELKVIRELVKQHYPGGRPPVTAHKSIQTSEEVINECEFKPLQDLVRFKKLQKLANTYLSKMFVPVLHPRFSSVGAASDRTSSSGPNMQNQPRVPGIRDCCKARAGYVYLACDFDSQEMRTLAQSCLDICGKSRLAERYQQDAHYDPHLEFAALLGNIPFHEAKRLHQAGDKRIKELRQQSKAANFGYPGGMGAEKFQTYARGYGVELTKRQSEELRKQWMRQWPEMEAYFDHVKAVVGEGGVGVQTIPRSGFRRGNCGYSDTANGYFQTLAAHAAKASMFEVCRRAYSERSSWLYGSRPVLFIHDEIILETPEEIAHLAAEELEELMRTVMSLWTPDVPTSASATLMRRWSKSAERVYKDGRLVPWEE